MATKRKITKPVRKTVKKRLAKKSTKAIKRPRRVAPAVTAPAPILSTPVVPIEPVLPTLQERKLTQPANRLKLWLAVSVSMAVIVVIWAYTLSQSVLSSNAINDTLANSEIDEFVSSVSSSLSELKANSDTTITPINTHVNQPTTEELDNLFSDIE